MPEPDRQERITRLRELGLLSEDQARRLAASLGLKRRESPRRNNSATGMFLLIAGLLGVVGLATLVLLAGGEATQAAMDVSETINREGSYGNMSKLTSAGIGITLFLVLPLLLWVWLHNSLVNREEAVLSSWAQVESSYQRRADLIPALVDTVSRFVEHERETLESVTETRAGRDKLRELAGKLSEQQENAAALLDEAGGAPEDEQTLRELARTQRAIGSGLGRLIAVAEDYPDLRSSDQFLRLQAQLEGTENRINLARVRFNEAVRVYNGALRRMPHSLVASAGGFRRKAYFEADEGADSTRELDFER